MKLKDILNEELKLNEMADVTIYGKKKPEVELEAAKKLAELINADKTDEAIAFYKKSSGKAAPKSTPGILKRENLITATQAAKFRAALLKALPDGVTAKSMGPGGRKNDNPDADVVTLDKIKNTIGVLYDQYLQDLRLLDPDFNGSTLNMTGAAKLASDSSSNAKKKREEFINKHKQTLKDIKLIQQNKGKFKLISDEEFGKLSSDEKKRYMGVKKQADEIIELENKINSNYTKTKEVRTKRPKVKAEELISKTADRDEEADKFRKLIKKYDNAEDITKIDMMRIKSTLQNMVDNTPTAKEYDAELKTAIKAIKRNSPIRGKRLSDSEVEAKIKKLTLTTKKNKDMIVSQVPVWRDAITKATKAIEAAGTSNELDIDEVEEIMDILSGKRFESVGYKKKNSLMEDIIGNSGINK